MPPCLFCCLFLTHSVRPVVHIPPISMYPTKQYNYNETVIVVSWSTTFYRSFHQVEHTLPVDIIVMEFWMRSITLHLSH